MRDHFYEAQVGQSGRGAKLLEARTDYNGADHNNIRHATLQNDKDAAKDI